MPGIIQLSFSCGHESSFFGERHTIWPPCDIFSDALPPVGPFDEQQSGLQPWVCDTLQTVRNNALTSAYKLAPSSHSIKSGLILVAEEL